MMNSDLTDSNLVGSHSHILFGETTYYVIAGNDFLYGLTNEQLKALRDITKVFIDEEVEKLPQKMEKSVNFGARITKTISLEEDDEHFRCHYSIGSCEGDILGLSYPRIKRLHEMLGHFLCRYGDEEQSYGTFVIEGEKVQSMGVDEGVRIAAGEDFAFELREELNRGKVSAEKCIYWENGEKYPQAYYMIYANGCECSELSLLQLKRVNEEIGRVLEET